ncbi:MAG TPA: hypothetical protein VGK19_08645 [Capsulimonadaceae bacterium]|jgi:protein arginine kinase activator
MLADQPEQLGLFGKFEGLGVDDLALCPSCSTSLAQVYVDGRVGCEQCYVAFRDDIKRALVMIHGTSRHTGKTL